MVLRILTQPDRDIADFLYEMITSTHPNDSGLKIGFHSENHEENSGNGYDCKLLPAKLTGDLKLEKAAQMSPLVFFPKITLDDNISE